MISFAFSSIPIYNKLTDILDVFAGHSDHIWLVCSSWFSFLRSKFVGRFQFVNNVHKAQKNFGDLIAPLLASQSQITVFFERKQTSLVTFSNGSSTQGLNAGERRLYYLSSR